MEKFIDLQTDTMFRASVEEHFTKSEHIRYFNWVSDDEFTVSIHNRPRGRTDWFEREVLSQVSTWNFAGLPRLIHVNTIALANEDGDRDDGSPMFLYDIISTIKFIK